METLLFFAFVPVLAIWRGFVLSVLWGWFVVPTFGLPFLSLVPAIGVALVVSFLTSPAPKRDDKVDFGWTIGVGLVDPAVALGAGFILHLFI